MKSRTVNVLLVMFILVCLGALFALKGVQESAEVSAPSTAQSSATAKDEPSETPEATPSETATEDADEDADDEVDMTNYKVHRLPTDSDTWTDQEWEWWLTAASAFETDYEKIFEDHFGYTPESDIVETAQNFAEEVCLALDKGHSLDDVAEGIIDSTDNKKSQMALAMAVHPGVKNFCPWHKKLLS